jgi:hypothetical protein
LPEEEGIEDYASVFQDKEIDDAKAKDVGEKLSGLLKVITEDARQLTEYLTAESSMVNQICGYLSKILTELNLSVVLPQKTVPELDKAKELILNTQCLLVIVQKDGKVESKSLESYPPETILMVVWALIPRLREEVSLYMKKVSIRLNFLEMVNDELKNIQRPFEKHEDKPIEDFQENKVKKVLIPQQ